MKGLRFQQGEFNFIVDINCVLHIDDYASVKNEIEDVGILNFQKIFNTGGNPSEIIFIGKGKNIKGLLVEKVTGVFTVKNMTPLEKGGSFATFIDTISKTDDNILYVIDFQKIIGVDYEQKSPSY